MKKRLLIVGGHGSGEIAMSVFQEANKVTNEWDIEGFLNDIIEPGGDLGKFKVLGPSEAVKDYVCRGYFIHYALHFNAKDKEHRVKKFNEIEIPMEANASAIHPSAYLDPSTKIGYGTLICAHACTSFGSVIGNFVHIYTNGFIGHDSIIKDFSTITAHSVIGGRVTIDEGAHVGLNSTIREDLRIGKYSIVGIGSVVTKNVEDYSIYIGNPAQLLKKVI